jgi:O-acetyl-ADP-ribose deacetylase (regulator of RNase III)
MIKYKNGDLLKSDCNIICHQVNLQGVMGGGIALQIANKHPKCEKVYRRYIFNVGEKAFGKVLFCKIAKSHYIANCFTQTHDYKTDYEQVKKCFISIANIAQKYNLSVGIPYKYGCGIANGDWNIVEKILKDIFLNTNIDCQIWIFNK